MRTRTISIGGATYDVFIQLDKDTVTSTQNDDAFTFPLGSKIHTQKVIESCGGGASNTSVGLSRLGCDAGFCGVVSDDQWGEKLLQNLKNEKVDTRCATIVEEEVSSFSIILTSGSGDRVILYDPGANKHLHDAIFNKEMVCNAQWMYLNHIQENSCVIQDDLIEIVTMNKDMGLTWNPGGCQIEAGIKPENNRKLLSHTNLLLLNKEEALKFTEKESVDEAIKALLQAGVTNVCITSGSAGSKASDGKQVYECPIIKTENITDTTGAGDAFGVGASWALMQGRNLPESMQAGSINAASVVQYIGAQDGLL
ncbi:carbohydrate kinase family protein, partial [Candidatus Peregrinibacteria bacterium]|nr:carbohydrate kinase family protein [Candidatus Peregrinibacteria bacterium]